MFFYRTRLVIDGHTALDTLSLSRDPLADISRTVSEFDAVRFGECQQLHSITVDQLDFREIESDHAAFFERGAKNI